VNTAGHITGTGNASNDTIIDNSTGGANFISDGNAGGHDSMVDNAGNDTFIVHSTNDTVAENHASTTATVESYVSFTLGANLNDLILEGSSNLTGKGTAAGGNVLTGNTGN